MVFSEIKKSTIINSGGSCAECQTCCKFNKAEKYFVPLFTVEEVEKVREKFGGKILQSFKKYGKFDNVFQIKLKKLKDIFMCPFYDVSTAMCGIYELRSIDCKIWPFFITRSRDKKHINLVCFDRSFCPAYKKISEKKFDVIAKKMTKIFKRKKFIEFFKNHKGLIWDYEPDTFVICNMDELK